MIYQLYLKTNNIETLDKLSLYAGEHCGFFKSARYKDNKNATGENYLFCGLFPLREDYIQFSGVINHQFKDTVFVLNGLEKAKT